MAPPSSQASFEAANRQNDNASRHASQGFADLTSAINETWGAGMTRIHGVGQAIGENVNAAGAELARENRDVVRAATQFGDGVARNVHAAHQELDRDGRAIGQAATQFGDGVARNVHGAHQAVDRSVAAAGAELTRENRDVVRAATQFGDGVARNVHAAHQELDREGRVIGQAATAVGDTAQAGANRIGDHYRDRPLTAALEGVLGPIDGLARGGVGHENRTAAPGDATPTPTGTRPPHHVATAENSAEARPPAAGADHSHHQVKSGESYWSIAAAQGGTKAAILARSQHLQAANHGRALLPNLEIVMS